jgi:threonine dehydratase
VLENRDRFAGRRVATVICGSNVTTDDYERWVLRWASS